MSDTGVLVSGAVTTPGSWFNLTSARINTSDNSYASTLGSSYGTPGQINDFGISIPSYATIDGILISTEMSCSALAYDAYIKMDLSYDGGVNYTAELENSTTGQTDVTRSFGGATVTWGRSWTASELSNANFSAPAPPVVALP